MLDLANSQSLLTYGRVAFPAASGLVSQTLHRDPLILRESYRTEHCQADGSFPYYWLGHWNPRAVGLYSGLWRTSLFQLEVPILFVSGWLSMSYLWRDLVFLRIGNALATGLFPKLGTCSVISRSPFSCQGRASVSHSSSTLPFLPTILISLQLLSFSYSVDWQLPSPSLSPFSSL